jgi:hypothetical protein
METPLDLDGAASEIRRRTPDWTSHEIDVRPISSRDRDEDGPNRPSTDRASVPGREFVGVRLRKRDEESEVVVYEGGRVEYRFWWTEPRSDLFDEALDDCVTIERFRLLLDILAVVFA